MAKASTYHWQYLLLFFVLTWTLASSAIYKSVMWTTNNPLFQNHNKSDNKLKSFCYDGHLEMRVYLKSVLPLVCPFEDLIMQNMDSQPSSGVLYENLWIVYDYKSYNTCNINQTATFGSGSFPLKNKLLYKCDTPDTYKKLFYRIDFKEDSPVPGLVYFEANTTYYFLATSDGTQGSLDQTSGGHCDNDGDDEIRMKFMVYVCGTNEFYTDPKCADPNDIGVFKCIRHPPTTSIPPTTSSISPSPTISSAASSSTSQTKQSSTQFLVVLVFTKPDYEYNISTRNFLKETANTTICKWLKNWFGANLVLCKAIDIRKGSLLVDMELKFSRVKTLKEVENAIKSAAARDTNIGNGFNLNKSSPINKVSIIYEEKPNQGQRTGEDAGLRKSRDNWMIVAVMFSLLFIIALIVMAIICYRLKKKYSVPCIYSSQISASQSPETSPTNTMDKADLVRYYDNEGIDGVDGPKKTKDMGSVEGVEMKTQPPPPPNGFHACT